MMNKMLTALLALLLLLALPLVAQDKIYKVVDADGNVIYTDQKPDDDSEPLDLPELSIVDPVEIGTLPARAQDAPEAAPELIFSIDSPMQDETIWNTGFTVDVQMSLNTNIPAGTQIVLFVDGEQKATTRALSTTLRDVYRGPHTLRAELQSETGQVLASTDSVRFFIQQQSALRPRPG